jgi:threonine dehydratase
LLRTLRKISGLSAKQKAKGVVASSAGNHAQGVALSASKLGIESVIVMPLSTIFQLYRGCKSLTNFIT